MGPGGYTKGERWQAENARLLTLAAEKATWSKFTAPPIRSGDAGRHLSGEELEQRKRELLEREAQQQRPPRSKRIYIP